MKLEHFHFPPVYMNSSSESRSRAVIALIGASILGSSAGVLIKITDIDGLSLTGWRSLLVLVILMVVRPGLRFQPSKPLFGGALLMTLTTVTYVVSNKLTFAGNAIALQRTCPIYVALLAPLLLGEKTSAMDWKTVIIVVSGVALFFLDDVGAGNHTGNIIALSSGLFAALLTIAFRMQKDSSPLSCYFLGNLLNIIILAPFMIRSMPSGSDWAALTGLSLFQQVLAFLLFDYAIRRVTALESVIITSLSPVLTPIWTFIFISEVPGTWAIVGFCVVLGAVLVRSFEGSKWKARSKR